MSFEQPILAAAFSDSVAGDFYADVPSDTIAGSSFLDILSPFTPGHLPYDTHSQSPDISLLQLCSPVESVKLLSQAHTSFSNIPVTSSLLGLGISFDGLSSTSVVSAASSFLDLASSTLQTNAPWPASDVLIDSPPHPFDFESDPEDSHPLSVLSRDMWDTLVLTDPFSSTPPSASPLDSKSKGPQTATLIGLFPGFVEYDNAVLAAENAILAPPIHPYASAVWNQDVFSLSNSDNHCSPSASEHSILDIIDAFPQARGLECSDLFI